MSNLANIIEKILDESRQEAEAIWQEYRQKTSEIKANAEQAAGQSAEALQQKARLEAVELKRRALAVAELDARKRALATRQEMIDEAFASALGGLAALDEATYQSWIVQTVLEASETGDEALLVNSKDRPLFEKTLGKLNEALTQRGKKGALKLSGEPGGFSGGLVLIAENTEKNYTFETLLRLQREDIESDIASILFA